MSTTRRTLIRTAAWSVPVVAAFGTAPAFAASTDPDCSPYGFKLPGEPGDKNKTYVLTPACADFEGTVTAVTIGGQPATLRDNGTWVVTDKDDSRNTRQVTITTSKGRTWSGAVAFPPKEQQ